MDFILVCLAFETSTFCPYCRSFDDTFKRLLSDAESKAEAAKRPPARSGASGAAVAAATIAAKKVGIREQRLSAMSSAVWHAAEFRCGLVRGWMGGQAVVGLSANMLMRRRTNGFSTGSTRHLQGIQVPVTLQLLIDAPHGHCSIFLQKGMLHICQRRALESRSNNGCERAC